jgi:hypothetical protein
MKDTLRAGFEEVHNNWKFKKKNVHILVEHNASNVESLIIDFEANLQRGGKMTLCVYEYVNE